MRPPMPPEPKVSQPAPLKDLKGKVAYVTASSDGIGLGIARAASLAGMKVCIGYRNEERLKAALPLFKPGNAGVFPVKHDVTDRDAWAKALESIKSQFGKLHLVVNNAGFKSFAMVSKASAEDWDNGVAVNFTATYNSVVTCLPHMLEHGEGGHFVVTSSMSGLLPGVTAGVYTATKIAVVGLIEALRIELEGTTVGTSAFVPGGVQTDNYLGTGEENPYRKEQLAKLPAGCPPAFRRQRPVAADGSAGGRQARVERRHPQRPVHRHSSGVHARHQAALRCHAGVGAGGRYAALTGACQRGSACAARGHLPA